ncbi:MAG: ATP-binding protein [Armatimonadota bacterium]
MSEAEKPQSPFYPTQPVPVELFVGREAQIERVRTRGINQTAHGKPMQFFVQGEYAIGKSSIARVLQSIAERKYGLHGIYASLGGAKDLNDLAAIILEATLRSGAYESKRSEIMRNWLAKYIGTQSLFNFTVNLEKLRTDAPSLASPYGLLGFLTETLGRLQETEAKGIFLVLDEINGITATPDFSHFIKSLVDTNALSHKPLPLLLLLCGVEERRQQMIAHHQPIDRIFDIIDIPPLNDAEMEEFFTRSFGSVNITVEPNAMNTLKLYSAGIPRIMHLIGDAAFWRDRDNVINIVDAVGAIIDAADEFGKKFVDIQVYNSLRSADYRSTLSKIARVRPRALSFRKEQIASDLTPSEMQKFNNFIRKMKQLQVLMNGASRGEYVFTNRMVHLYITLQSAGEDL